MSGGLANEPSSPSITIEIMSKPVAEWTEDDVLSLPPGENDEFERKGARLLDFTVPGVREGDVRDELAKQLSAFANTGGGRIIYGLHDDGNVDNGGVARTLRGRRTTKDWLEDVIPNLTDFEIVGVNVHEIRPRAPASPIAQDKSLYVVEVPDSERAPHQSKGDLKYYIRLGGKSQPATHRLIEDIRNRAIHPRVEVHDLKIVSAHYSTTKFVSLRSEGSLHIQLTFGVRNVGRVRASNMCLRISGIVPLSCGTGEAFDFFQRYGAKGTVLLELRNPLYPGMGITMATALSMEAEFEVHNVGASLSIGGVWAEEVVLSFTSFADSAPARTQNFTLNAIDPQQQLDAARSQTVKQIRQA